MTAIANIEGALAGFLIGVLGWFMINFVGRPIREFWNLRGEVAHALNKYSRYISGPPSEPRLLFPVDRSEDSRQVAIKEFVDLAHRLIAFWDNEALARRALMGIGIRGDACGRMLLDTAEALNARNSLGPRRSDLVATLRLKP
jgi:hypothetical protein